MEIDKSNKYNKPWSIVENSWSDTTIYDCKGNTVCSLSIEHEATEENQEELEKAMNLKAKLIASAPELLDCVLNSLKG